MRIMAAVHSGMPTVVGAAAPACVGTTGESREIPDTVSDPSLNRLGVITLTHDIPYVPLEHLHESSDPHFLGKLLLVFASDGILSGLPLSNLRDQLPVVLHLPWAYLSHDIR